VTLGPSEGYCKFGKEKMVRDKEIEEAEAESDRLMRQALDDILVETFI
jgi:hypothetical protein